MPLSRARIAEMKRASRIPSIKDVSQVIGDALHNPGVNLSPSMDERDTFDPTIATLPERKRMLTDIIRAPNPPTVQVRDKLAAADQLNRLFGSYPREEIPRNVTFNINYIRRTGPLMEESIDSAQDRLPSGETIEGELVDKNDG